MTSTKSTNKSGDSERASAASRLREKSQAMNRDRMAKQAGIASAGARSPFDLPPPPQPAPLASASKASVGGELSAEQREKDALGEIAQALDATKSPVQSGSSLRAPRQSLHALRGAEEDGSAEPAPLAQRKDANLKSPARHRPPQSERGLIAPQFQAPTKKTHEQEVLAAVGRSDASWISQMAMPLSLEPSVQESILVAAMGEPALIAALLARGFEFDPYRGAALRHAISTKKYASIEILKKYGASPGIDLATLADIASWKRKMSPEQRRLMEAQLASSPGDEHPFEPLDSLDFLADALGSDKHAAQEARKADEASARQAADEAAQREADEAARREANEAAQREADEAAQREANEAAQREANEAAQREANEAAQREADEAAQREADETAQREANEAAQREADEAAQREADEAAQREADAESNALESLTTPHGDEFDQSVFPPPISMDSTMSSLPHTQPSDARKAGAPISTLEKARLAMFDKLVAEKQQLEMQVLELQVYADAARELEAERDSLALVLEEKEAEVEAAQQEMKKNAASNASFDEEREALALEAEAARSAAKTLEASHVGERDRLLQAESNLSTLLKESEKRESDLRISNADLLSKNHALAHQKPPEPEFIDALRGSEREAQLRKHLFITSVMAGEHRSLDKISKNTAVEPELAHVALAFAAGAGQIKSGEWLIANMGIHPGYGGELALAWALQAGHVEMARWLVSQGSDVHHAQEFALRIAVEKDDVAMLDALIEMGANPRAAEERTLRFAATQDAWKTFRALLAHGCTGIDAKGSPYPELEDSEIATEHLEWIAEQRRLAKALDPEFARRQR